MPTTKSPNDAGRDSPVSRPEPAPADNRDFRASFGEDLREVLDLGTWEAGRDVGREYARIEREVAEAVRDEADVQRRTHALVFPKLFDPTRAPPNGGFFK